MSASSGSRSGWDLDLFLRKLLTQKQSYASIFSSSTIPSWARHCASLLYSPQSVPSVFPEPNQLYLCYQDIASEVGLVGESHAKKRIDRTLKVEAKGSSVIVRSTHKNLKTNDFETFEGRGNCFETAISDYFAKSDLKGPDYQFTLKNVQKEGDAFLLQQMQGKKGHYLVDQMVAVIKKIFQVVPEDKQPEVAASIEEHLRGLSKIRNLPENKKLFNHYDPRLWVVIECLCEHFDVQEIELRRKVYRDHVIADCCSHLMKGKDILPRLQGYVDALHQHNEIMKELGSTLDYTKQNLCPEIARDRDKIKEYFDQVVSLRRNPPASRR